MDDYDERDYLLVCKDIPCAREISKNIEAVKKSKKIKKSVLFKEGKKDFISLLKSFSPV